MVAADLDYAHLLALGCRPAGLVLFRGGTFSASEMFGVRGRVMAAVLEVELRSGGARPRCLLPWLGLRRLAGGLGCPGRGLP